MALELRPEYNIPAVITSIGINLQGDFCWSRSFDQKFITSLMYEGFLIMCQYQGGKHLLLPKLHVDRCLLDFADLRVPKRIRSLAQPFTFSVDRDFEGVIKGCHQQHGQSWLYPPLVSVLRNIHKFAVSIDFLSSFQHNCVVIFKNVCRCFADWVRRPRSRCTLLSCGREMRSLPARLA